MVSFLVNRSLSYFLSSSPAPISMCDGTQITQPARLDDGVPIFCAPQSLRHAGSPTTWLLCLPKGSISVSSQDSEGHRSSLHLMCLGLSSQLQGFCNRL